MFWGSLGSGWRKKWSETVFYCGEDAVSKQKRIKATRELEILELLREIKVGDDLVLQEAIDKRTLWLEEYYKTIRKLNDDWERKIKKLK